MSLTATVTCDVCKVATVTGNIDKNELYRQAKEQGWKRARKIKDGMYHTYYDVCSTCPIPVKAKVYK